MSQVELSAVVDTTQVAVAVSKPSIDLALILTSVLPQVEKAQSISTVAVGVV